MLGGHEALLEAFNTDVRPLCAKVRADTGAAEDPLAALRASGYAKRRTAETRWRRHRGWRLGAMSTLERMIDSADDRWPAEGEVPDDALGQVVLASHLLGADRAVANFGGGNTSAKGTTEGPRRARGGRRSGSRGPVATWRRWVREDFTPLRLDDALPLFERDEMSDEDMVAHLAGQPARSGGAAVVDRGPPARLRARRPRPTTPTPTPSTCSREPRDGERLVKECFGPEAAWIPYIRPGFTLAKQVGNGGPREPGPPPGRAGQARARGLGRDAAEQAYRRTIDVINRAAEFVNARTAGQPRFGGSLPGAELGDEARRELLRSILPVVARRALQRALQSAGGRHLRPRGRESCARSQAPELVTVGAAFPDHLVHTKRLPLWVRLDPESEDAETLTARIPELAQELPARLRGLRAETP